MTWKISAVDLIDEGLEKDVHEFLRITSFVPLKDYIKHLNDAFPEDNLRKQVKKLQS